MNISVRANVRTAEAARHGPGPRAWSIGFKAGAVTGMLVAGLALLIGVAGYYSSTCSSTGGRPGASLVDALVALGFGASLISIFARLGRRHLHQGRRRRRRPGR